MCDFLSGPFGGVVSFGLFSFCFTPFWYNGVCFRHFFNRTLDQYQSMHSFWAILLSADSKPFLTMTSLAESFNILKTYSIVRKWKKWERNISMETTDVTKNVIFKKSGLKQTFDTILCQGCQKATASCCNFVSSKNLYWHRFKKNLNEVMK